MAAEEKTGTGRVWKYGDNISTDHILPSRFMTQVEPHELAANCMAGADRDFAKKVKPGDVLVAGYNIGYGSSREQAPQALKYAGVSAVIAKSFARIFYRNCYNVGLPAISCREFVDEVSEGDLVEVDLKEGSITNKTTGKSYHFIKPPEFLLDYIQLGGLIPYLEKLMAQGVKKERGHTCLSEKLLVTSDYCRTSEVGKRKSEKRDRNVPQKIN